MRAVNLVPFEYVLKHERDLDEKTIFTIRGMNGSEGLRHTSLLLSPKERVDEAFLYVVGCCLISWDGLIDSQGKDIKFSDNTKDNLNLLSSDVISELYLEIEASSKIDGAQKKK